MKLYKKVIGRIIEEDEIQGRYTREEEHEDSIVMTKKELRDLLDNIVYEVTEVGMGGCSVIHHYTGNYIAQKLNLTNL